MEPRYQALEKEVAGQQIPPVPPTYTPGPAPTLQDAQKQTMEQGWVTAAMFLGVLGGAMTRRPITNALAAFTGMANGLEEGNQKKFDDNMKTWEAENKRAQEATQNAQRRYENILKNNALSIEQKKIMMQIEGYRWDDLAVVRTAEQKGLEELGHIVDGRDKFLGDLDRTTGTAGKSMQQQMWDTQARAWVQSPEGQQRAQAIAEYRYPPVTTLGRTGYQGSVNQALMDRVFQINPGYDDTQWEGKKAGAKVAGTTDERVRQRTEIAFAVGPESRSVRSLNVAIDHLDAMEKWASALKNNDIQTINRIKNYLITEFGGAAPNNLMAARQIVGGEIVKAISNNGGGVTERQEAQKYFSTANSPEQIAQLSAVYRRLLAGQMNGLEQQYIGGGGAGEKFEQTKLLPRTREALTLARTQDIPDIADEALAGHINRLANQMDKFLKAVATGTAEQIESAAPGPAAAGEAGAKAATSVGGYISDVWSRAQRKGWSLTPLDERPQ